MSSEQIEAADNLEHQSDQDSPQATPEAQVETSDVSTPQEEPVKKKTRTRRRVTKAEKEEATSQSEAAPQEEETPTADEGTVPLQDATPATDEQETDEPVAEGENGQETVQVGSESDTEGSHDVAPTAEEEAETARQKTLREQKEEELARIAAAASANSLLFYSPDLDAIKEQLKAEEEARRAAEEAERRERRLADLDPEVTSRRRRRRRRGDADLEFEGGTEGDPEDTVVKVRAPRLPDSHSSNRVTGVRGSTRLEAKRLRRRETRATGRRRQIITEAEFLARRESVDRQMLVRQKDDRIQIGVLEDGVLAEHFVSKTQQDSLIGNVYLGKVQNVLPSMEAAFVDIGRGRNAVLYAGEVNWDVSGLDGAPRKIENALKAGDSVLVQVTKDPVGHKGARLTSQVSLPGRYLVYVPGGSMTGISRKLPDVERQRLKKILKDKLPEDAGVIVRTAAEGASEEELSNDINRLRVQWEEIKAKSESRKVLAPELLYQEPDLTIKTVRDVFNEDFTSMMVQGQEAWDSIEAYVTYVAPDLLDRLKQWEQDDDLFDHYRIEEQLQKALDRKVYLPSGGSLVIDRTEAMTVVDVNTGKFTGSGGNLEETVTKNNLEAAEEIVRQLRLRDIGGIIVVDFIDMVLESNRELVLRRLVECLGRDRTKHQVAEVTSLGLVQMTRKRMGTGLLEVFSEPCDACAGRGLLVHDQPLKGRTGGASDFIHRAERDDRKRYRNQKSQARVDAVVVSEIDESDEQKAEARKAALANLVAATNGQHDDEQGEAESKSARKRKRRKRNRRAEGGLELTGSRQGAEQVLMIGDEVIELPTGSEVEPTSENMGEQGSFTLETLAAVFDSDSLSEAESQPSSERDQAKGRGGRKRQELSADDLSVNSDASLDVDPEADSRFTQSSTRLDAIRAAEARARASQRAGREYEPRDGEESSGATQGAAERTERSTSRRSWQDRDASSSDNGQSRGRRPRRASSSDVKYIAPIEVAPEPGVTGVATPGKKATEPATEDPKTTVVAEPVAEAPRKKRRPRRAVSSGAGSSAVKTENVVAARGTSVVASVEQIQKPAIESEDGPVMLGVGVSAADIKRQGL